MVPFSFNAGRLAPRRCFLGHRPPSPFTPCGTGAEVNLLSEEVCDLVTRPEQMENMTGTFLEPPGPLGGF